MRRVRGQGGAGAEDEMRLDGITGSVHTVLSKLGELMKDKSLAACCLVRGPKVQQAWTQHREAGRRF